MKYSLAAGLASLALIAAPLAFAKEAPLEWDGLRKIDTKKFDIAYLLPGADFKGYTKVMIDPTEVAFRKNWQRDFNSSQIGLDLRISDDEARKILAAAQTGFQEIFVKAYRDAGYEVVTTPAPDVMRLKTGVFNIVVVAPDQMSAGRSRNFSSEAGSASLIVEVRDSMSGAVMARGIDTKVIGDDFFAVYRNRVSNISDFERAFKQWSKMSVEGVAALKALPPTAVAQN